MSVTMDASAPRISIVIPTWNGKTHLAHCLPTLQQQSFQDFEVIVVDNGSQDGTAQYLRESFPRVKIVAFDNNRGFSAAINAGIRESAGQYIALLNNDTEADPHWLEQLNRAAQENPQTDCFACKILCLDDPSILDAAGDGYSGRGVAWNIGKGLPDSPFFNQPRWVFSPCAAAAFYRRRFFDTVGLFDEDLFAFYEDVDLGFRGQLLGKKCLYVPTAVVLHRGGGTLAHHSPGNLRYCSRNALLVLAKNMPARLLCKNLPFTLFTYARHLLRHLLKKGHRWAIVTGYGSAFLGLPKALIKRCAIQKDRRINDRDLDAMLRSYDRLLKYTRKRMKIESLPFVRGGQGRGRG